jgi:hypothetical protein
LKQSSRSSAKADGYNLFEDILADASKKAIHRQIWKINLTQSVGNNTKTQEVYAVVSQKKGETTWVFERLMFDKEIAARNVKSTKTTPTGESN